MSARIIFIIFLSAFFLYSCKKTTGQLFDEASALIKKEKYDEGIKIYTELIHRNNKLQSVYYNRGYCYFSKNEYKPALADYNRIMDLKFPGNGITTILHTEGLLASEEAGYQVPYFDVLYQRAQVYFYLNMNTESFRDFKTLIDGNFEEKANCYLWQGSIFLNTGDTSKACTYFTYSKKYSNNERIEKEAEKMINMYCNKRN